MFFILQLPQEKTPDIDILINTYSKSLTKLCYLFLKDVHLAEEAAWDALYKAYRGYTGFRGESSEKTWITQIAVNVCKSYMRKSSYKEINGSNYISLAYTSEDPSLVEFKSDESLALLNAVYDLPIKYKQVILLRYYEQLSISEIANMLKEKENTISVRIKRAHAKLKDVLKEN
ncbi:MAG: sigma-70 family RNA polymerase sigma factor [Clostridiaceae bacterium]|nr:sigma-70 family RNA polymerase sigma factor [Clostridiaceae bacterium]